MSQGRRQFQQFLKTLARDFHGQVKERVGMKRHTTFKIGGLAEVMAWPEGLADLEAAVELAKDMELPWRILGRGSNLLAKDAGVDEVIIKIPEAEPEIELPLAPGEEGASPEAGKEEIVIRLQAGIKMPLAVKQCQVNGLAGLEWAAGIPGSVGGAVIMNAGSLGSSMSESLCWVEFFRPGQGVSRVERKDLDFQYRRLGRPSDAVVVGCGIKFKRDDPRAIQERIVKGLKWRRQTQPLSYPSAGSVFKNPPNDYAGRMIEAVGLKGERKGDAQISDLHANFIVNRGRARSRDVIWLIEMAREKVAREFGTELELEIEVIGKELS